MAALPTTIPHGHTARRLEWGHLPEVVRSVVERLCGSPVVSTRSCSSGFTPGFASVLTCEDGSRHFVKAASVRAQRMFADAYREEARKLAAMPADAPAPRLLWVHDDQEWVALGIEYVDARPPWRPWTLADLDVCLALTSSVAAALTPPSPDLVLDPFAEEFSAWPALWDRVPQARPDLPPSQVAEAKALAARFRDVTEGRTVVHTDIRDDNILIRPDGTAVLCDWNWPVIGAAWLDTVFLMIGPRGDGLDVDAVLASHPLTREVPPEHVDVAIALITAYFMSASDEPVPSTSPHIRDHQRWQELVCWDWLASRRGWA